MDDSTVSIVSLKNVLSQQAYILFYNRVFDSPPVTTALPISSPPPALLEKSTLAGDLKVIRVQEDLGEAIGSNNADAKKRIAPVLIAPPPVSVDTDVAAVVREAEGEDNSGEIFYVRCKPRKSKSVFR
jgi:hypothetical protein